jgi:Chaperone of endosialidase
MKITQLGVWAITLALFTAGNLHAQNVGIGSSSPQSKLTVNGNLAVGADYNTAAPTNGALIEGNLGIGTTTPLAPLHVGVASNFNLQNSSSVTYFNYNNNNTTGFTVTPLTGTQAASALFSSNIFSGSSFVSTNGTFLAASDARLKNIIGRSDSAKDLETLQKIEVTDYTMKDTVKFGNRPFKKVIAQQVEKVYPTAVTSTGIKGFTFTPDIYAVSESVNMEKPGVYTISLAKAHNLKDGDTVRLITSKKPELNVVAHVLNDKEFSVETNEALGERVFVYGKQCTDLKAIDYDAISMLNVSATQELAKKVTTLERENSDLQDQAKRLTAIEEQERTTLGEQGSEIVALKTANASLKTEMAQLKVSSEKLAAMAAKIEVLEKALATVQQKENGGVTTVALEQ